MTSADNENKPAVVCVFCGSVSGKSEAHVESARALAQLFHKENITLVYGGGTGGLMGAMARELVKLSGPKSVHGVIPRALVKVEEGYRSTYRPGEDGAGATGHKANGGEGEEGEGGMGGKAPERKITTSGTEADMAQYLQESEYGITYLVPDMHTRKRTMAQKVMEGGPGSGFVALAGGFGTIEEVMEMVTWNQLGIHHRGIVLLNINGYWDGLLAWVKNSVEEGFVSAVNAGILVECKDVGEVLGALRDYQLSPGRFVLDWSKA